MFKTNVKKSHRDNKRSKTSVSKIKSNKRKQSKKNEKKKSNKKKQIQILFEDIKYFPNMIGFEYNNNEMINSPYIEYLLTYGAINKDFRDLNGILKIENEDKNHSKLEKMIDSILRGKNEKSLRALIFICDTMHVDIESKLWIKLLSYYFNLVIEIKDFNNKDEILKFILEKIEISHNNVTYININSEDVANQIFEIGILYSKKYRLFRNSFNDLQILNQSVVLEAYGQISNIVNVIIPDWFTTIGNKTFNDCNQLVSIRIPDSIISISDNSFHGCHSLKSVDIPRAVTTIGSSAFEDCNKLTSVDIPKSVISIGDSAFRGCQSLTHFVIPKGIIRISNYSFNNCISLKTVVIPPSVIIIGFYAFSECWALKSIVIPKSVNSIEGAAFFGCNSLTSIVIPNGVTSIEEGSFF